MPRSCRVECPQHLEGEEEGESGGVFIQYGGLAGNQKKFF